jgi:ParB family transcriptional regulator, chromosome partitioning protein
MASRRSGLGRGLGALIPTGNSEPEVVDSTEDAQTVDIRDRTFREVAINSIRPNTYQPRKNLDQAELRPLADSIAELGVLQPILVRPLGEGAYELIAGERRWRASQVAGLQNVPVIVRDTEDVQSLEQALVENLHRKDLNPMDEAAAYRQLIDDFSMTHESVAQRVGKSRAAITNLLRLLQLQPKIQKMMIEEKITEGHGRALLGTDDEAFQLQLAERVAREGMTVRAVEDAVRLRTELDRPHTKKRTASRATPSKAAAAVLEWQDRLSDYLDTRVTITASSRSGRIVIEFADLEDLDRVAGIVVHGAEEASE